MSVVRFLQPRKLIANCVESRRTELHSEVSVRLGASAEQREALADSGLCRAEVRNLPRTKFDLVDATVIVSMIASGSATDKKMSLRHERLYRNSLTKRQLSICLPPLSRQNGRDTPAPFSSPKPAQFPCWATCLKLEFSNPVARCDHCLLSHEIPSVRRPPKA